MDLREYRRITVQLLWNVSSIWWNGLGTDGEYFSIDNSMYYKIFDLSRCLRFDNCNLIFFFRSFFFVLFSWNIPVSITIIYVHGVRDRTVYDKKEKKNNKGEEVKKIVGWIWTSWRWPRFYEHCYADRVREWKKGGRRGMKRGVKGARMNGNTLVQTHLLTVEFWYRLICFDGGQIRHESTEKKPSISI